MDARAYCSAVMLRYIKLLDDCTYMPNEHIQKEKEYGIPWRSAYKVEIRNLVDELAKKFLGSQAEAATKEDPFLILHQIVKKDVIDAATFDTKTQAEYLGLMTD